MKRLLLALPAALLFALASCDSDPSDTPTTGGTGGAGGSGGRAGGGTGGRAGAPQGGAGGGGAGQTMGGPTGGTGGGAGAAGAGGEAGAAGTGGESGAGGEGGAAGASGAGGAAGTDGAGGAAGTGGQAGTGGAAGAGGTGGTGGVAGTGGTSGTGGTGGTGGAAGTGGAGGTGGAAGAGGGPPTNNGFPGKWPDGLSCAEEPAVTVWSYDSDTYILRQSLCTNFEGPFLYLLFGENKAFLQDTGTGHVNVAATVGALIDAWLAKKGKTSIELVVTHSHSHGDHVGGDAQFAGKPRTKVVGTTVTAVQSFFGITNWPTQIATFELGGRALDVIPIPGHQNAHVAVYDKSRGLLLTGDSLYPGRLYVNNWAAYGQSLQRLVDFVAADHPVTWVLGTHIEMSTTPGDDYPMGANKHPNEHPLQLTQGTLLELHGAVKALGPTPQYQVHDDFIIFPL